MCGVIFARGERVVMARLGGLMSVRRQEKALRQKRNFCERNQSDLPCPALRAKIFRL